MRRQKRLGSLLLAAALVALALGCQSEAERLEAHLTKGEAALTAEQWVEAEQAFAEAVKIDPNSAAAHYGLARSHLARRQMAGAFWELEETVRLDPGNLEARQRHGELLLFGNREEFERALENADAILAATPGDWKALLLRGRALDALDRTDEAGAAFAEAVHGAPDEPAALLLFANHLRKAGRAEEAEATFRHLTQVHPQFASHAALATFLASEGRDEEAEAAFRAGIEDAEPGERTTATQALASFLVARDRSDDAQRVLEEAVEAAPDDVELLYALARFHHAAGRTAEADALIARASRMQPGQAGPLLLLSSYRGRIGDLDGALEAADAALAAAPDDVLAKLRRAEVLVDFGVRDADDERIAEGREVVDAVLADQSALPEALFVAAKVDLARQRYPEAIASLRRAIDGKPDWAQAHFLLGTALLVSGDANAARSEVTRAIELDASNPDAFKVLSRVHARLGDHDLAIEAGERALAATPRDYATRVRVAESLVAERRLDEALGSLLTIPEEARGAEGNFAIGRVYAIRDESDNARRYLLRALELAPGSVEVLRALADVDRSQDRLGESLERVRAARDAAPDDPGLQVLAGDIALASGDLAGGEAAYRRAVTLDPNRLDAQAKLARLFVATGRGDEAIATYGEALERRPDSGALHLQLALVLEASGRLDEAVTRYERAIEAEPDLAVAKNNLAYLLAERGGDLDRALDLAQEAKAALPDNPNVADTLGWVLYKKELPGVAIGYLREAVGRFTEGDPNRPLVRHHLALAYVANDETDQAVEALEDAVRDIDALDAEGKAVGEAPWARAIRQQLEQLRERG